MKKCASCTKDLPDAALHCVFCGAKQLPAPAVQPGLAKTAFGYSANDALDQVRQGAVPQGRATPQPAPPQPPPLPAYNPPPYNPPRPAPVQPMPAPVVPQQLPIVRPPPGPHSAGPQGGFVPPSPASAPTMFSQGGPQPPQPPQPQLLQSQPQPGYGRPAAALPPTLVPPPSAAPTQLAGPPAPPIPMMRIPVPVSQPPPYRASQPDAHLSRPIEPWRDSLRLVMFVWGVGLLIAFATPLQTSPLLFSWNLVLDGQGLARLPPLMLAAVGVLSVLLASIPMQPSARGAIAAVLGLAGVAVPIALVGMPPWQELSSMIGVLVLVPGLLLRHEYRHAALPRILVTIGAIGILLPFLVPHGGAIPLVVLVNGLIDVPGKAKIEPALALALIVIVVMSLLAWLPAPVSGGAKVFAWLVILWTLVIHVTMLLAGGNLGDVIKAAPNGSLVAWIAGGKALSLGSAYLALVGYGLASMLGKQLE